MLNIIGPYPPPIGGISIHIKRIKDLLDKEGIEFRIFNHGFFQDTNIVATRKSYWWYVKELITNRNGLYHFHQFMYLHFPFYFIKSNFGNSKIIITIHSSRLLIYNRIKQKIALFLLKYTKYEELLVVSESLSYLLKSKGIPCKYLPAYVPPIKVEKIILEEAETKWFLFSMWKVTKELSENVYNLPLSLSFLNNIKLDYKMLFLIGSEQESDLEYLSELIEAHGLQQRIKILFNKNITDYINNCEFILRTNIHDGYGVSLQESLDLGVPAIASDVCRRPEGTVIFESNNLRDLLRVFRFVVIQGKQYVLNNRKELTYHKLLLKIYKKYI